MTTYELCPLFHDQKSSALYPSGLVKPAPIIGHSDSEPAVGIDQLDINMMASRVFYRVAHRLLANLQDLALDEFIQVLSRAMLLEFIAYAVF